MGVAAAALDAHRAEFATPHADVGVDPPPRRSRQIVHVQLFRPMAVDEWRAAIGATVPLRPFPLR